MRPIYPNLHKRMQECGVTMDDIAALCEITRIRCALKLYGVVPWTFTEVVRICRLLDDKNAESLFVRLDIIS